MASLGYHGRWGNQILQYIFLKTFAKTHGFAVETGRLWDGRLIFDFPEGDISGHPRTALLCGCSKIHEQSNWEELPLDLSYQAAGHLYRRSFSDVYLLENPAISGETYDWPFRTAELEGLFMVHTAHLARHREFILDIFPVREPLWDRIHTILDFWRARHTLVVLHARRGDYEKVFLQQGFELITPGGAYLDWLSEICHRLDDPLVILCSDGPERIKPTLSKYKPIQPSELGLYVAVRNIPQLSTLRKNTEEDNLFLRSVVDWLLMTQADALAISNSTFSFSAALLNQNARAFVRPVFDKPQLIPFDPWNSEPLMFLPREGITTIPKLMLARSGVVLRGAGFRALPHVVSQVVKRCARYLIVRLYLCWKLEGARAFFRELVSSDFYKLKIGRIYGGPETESQK